ncbi:MAG: helix-turn-helix domain-containing protein [Bacteroidota bacterium]
MGEVLFTTHDVANILRVDKSTIKRWTDEGKLRCFRTPGGHRKFRSDDVYDFITSNNYGKETLQSFPQVMSDEMIIRSIVNQKEYNMLHSVCFSAAIKGNKEELLNLFTETISAGLSVAALFDYVLKPTTKKLNFLVQQNKLSVSEYHLAHTMLSSVLIKLNDTVTKLPKNFKTIVCASIENGKNEIELTALMTLLEVNGYTVLNLGTGINADAINQFVTRTKPYAVALYSSSVENKEQLTSQMHSVAEYAKSNGSHCFIGGNGFSGIDLTMQDTIRYCSSFEEFETLELSKLRSNITIQK